MEWPYDMDSKIEIELRPFFSNKASDLDNVAKPTLDALQQVFKWNDKHVYKIIMFKEVVKKGEEKLEINIKEKE